MLILDIFSQRAQTAEAVLQVEMAQLEVGSYSEWTPPTHHYFLTLTNTGNPYGP
jgi:hypothetical protein